MGLLVTLLFFLSGVSGLLYEVVWIRLASTVLGHTTHAVGTVVGVFMGGMALGSWLGGRQADRRSGASLVGLYGALEAGVAVSALAVPLLISAFDPLFRMLWGVAESIGPLYVALRVLLMALVLLLPTTLMGATLPVLARFLAVSGGSLAGAAGRAYGANTLGGVLGTLGAGFVLIPAFGLQATTLTAAALNLAIGAAAFLLARGRGGEVRPAVQESPAPARVALWVSALSGFAALAYEVAWTRALILAMGSTVYSFTLILAVFILGLAAGGALGGRLAARISEPRTWLAWSQAGIGGVALLLLPQMANLPLTFAGLIESLRRDYGTMLLAQSGLIALVILPPTLLMGVSFPLACRAAGSSAGGEGRAVAAIYSANTLGSILGTLVGTFALLPAVGLASTIRLAAGVNLATAGVLLWRTGPRGAVQAALLAALFGAGWLLPAWNPNVMSSGAYYYGIRDLRTARRQGVDLRTVLENSPEIIDTHWDSYGLVTIHQDGRALIMRVNGKVDATNNLMDMRTQTYVSHLPLLHHPSPKRVMVVGLGAGFSLGTALCYPGVERADCVEISPAVVRGAAHFAQSNGDCLKDPRARLVLGDGRQAIRYGREPWDVIICQPSNLWLSGMANLFTKDFFLEAREHLAPDGIFCQWVHSYRLGFEEFAMIMRTFFEVYPGGSVWEVLPGGDYVMMGSLSTARRSWPETRRRLEQVLPRSPELADAEQGPGPFLLGHLVADADTARRVAGPGPVLTDDRCAVEYAAPRTLYQEHRHRTLEWLDRMREEGVELRLYDGLEEADRKAAAARRVGRREVARAMALYTRPPPPGVGPGTFDARGPDSIVALDEAVKRHGGDTLTRKLLQEKAAELVGEAEESRAAGYPDIAVRYLRAVPAGSSLALKARLLQARLLGEAKDVQGMREAFDGAERADPASLEALRGVALTAWVQERFQDSVDAWGRFAKLRPEDPAPHVARAMGLRKLEKKEEARAAVKKALDLKPDDPTALSLLKELGGP
jgi:spermidine synthase